jgi:hypothetical protein
MTEEQKAELNYLRWFHGNADFGPAEGDVRHYLNEQYVAQTGSQVPEGYDEE